ncbi:MAG TPA: hypothetical protein VGE29_01725, partial [Prosthecobacter sp.]
MKNPPPASPASPPPTGGARMPGWSGRPLLWAGAGVAVAAAAITWSLWPAAKNYTPVPVVPSATTVASGAHAFVMQDEKAAFAQYAGSQSCKECHAVEYDKWRDSHHGLAERKPDDALDLAGFQPPQTFKHGSQTTEVRKTGSTYEIVSLGFDNKVQPWPVERVIGHAPLRQFLVNGQNGRLHAMEACFDPKVRDWFN